MRRLLVASFITAYLGALAFFLAAQVIDYAADKPHAYFFTWDMFWDWSAHSRRTHVIGQGSSGRWYEILPGPWPEFRPFGGRQRHDYDWRLAFARRMAETVLQRTAHEPIHSVYIIEESWPSVHNVPESLRDEAWVVADEEHYFRLRASFRPGVDGMRVYPRLEQQELTASLVNGPVGRPQQEAVVGGPGAPPRVPALPASLTRNAE